MQDFVLHQDIYIRHADENGIFYNIELASKAFPGTGTIQTLTYTPVEAIKTNIALREMDLKQSIALCLVYLAKGYEYKYKIKDNNFILDCAETTLEYDEHNLNAMLLKAEVLENRLTNQKKNFAQLQKEYSFLNYQEWITHIYRLGYREMPLEMKNLLIKGWSRDTFSKLEVRDYTPQRLNSVNITPTRYASLSWGLFDEEIKTKPIERFGNTLFNTKKKKIVGFLNSDILYNQYNFDPIVFAWSIDPMADKYPGISPYTAFADNPIIFKDNAGNFVEGMNGRPVTYKMLTGGKILWSSNASAATRRIGGSMLKTVTGREMFEKAQNTSYPVAYHLNKPNDADFGKTDITGHFGEDGKYVVQRADVYVNPKAMEAWKRGYDESTKGVKNINSVLIDKMNSTPDGDTKQAYQYYYLLITGQIDAAVGATGSHETEHATNQSNIQAEKEHEAGKRDAKTYNKDVEEVPEHIEQKDLNERTPTTSK